MSSKQHHHQRLRHARVKEIFYEVSGLEPAARAAFLRDACQRDEELRREVESLLTYHREQQENAEARQNVPRVAAPGRVAAVTASASPASSPEETSGEKPASKTTRSPSDQRRRPA